MAFCHLWFLTVVFVSVILVNTDLWSCHQSRYSRALLSFMKDHNLTCGLQDFSTKPTWFSADFHHSSRIDYAITTQNMKRNVSETVILDNDVWNSDHIPVQLSIPFVGNMQGAPKPDFLYKGHDKRLNCGQASLEQLRSYERVITELLDEIRVPAEAAVCNDVGECNHRNEIERYYDEIT